MPVVPLVLVALALLAPAPPSCLLPPVESSVADPFREPSCVWCPGNRGLTYDTVHGGPVRAAASGIVTFSGVVAGTRYVVVEHADGLRATYGGLATADVRAGDAVVAGAVVGRSTSELHFGLRQGDRYVDPTALIGRLVERPRLVPTDGTPARPGPPPRVRCAASSAG